MGRNDPKLPPFLKLHLELDDFKNLKWEDEDKYIFYLELPRYDRDKCRKYEDVLKAWYEFNGKSHKYKGYSHGKSVVQAALKKSLYLISLPSIGKQLRFQFATSDQVKENKRLLKEKGKNDVQPTRPSNLSSAASSGYQSDVQPSSPGSPFIASSGYQSDSEVESVQITENQDAFLNDGNQFSERHNGFLNDVLNNPEKYIDDFEDFCKELCVDVKEKMPLQNIQLDAFKPPEELSEFKPPLEELPEFKPTLEELSHFMRPVTEWEPPPEVMPHFERPVTEMKPPPEVSPQFMGLVTELKPSPVGVCGASIKKYWLCTQKIVVKTTLQLICELKVIENENSGIKEGSVVIPNEVFEPGISYELKKYVELDDIQYYFFSPNSV